MNLAQAAACWLLRVEWWSFVALLALVAWAAAGYLRALTPVTLAVDGVSRQVRTRQVTVGALLDDVGVVVHEWDRVNPGRDAPLREGMPIQVWHALPVTVVADGTTRTVYAHSQRIGEILSLADLTLRPGDELWVNGERAAGGSGQRALLAQEREAAPLRAASSRGPRQPAPPLLSHVEVRRATLMYVSEDGASLGGGNSRVPMEQAVRTMASTVGQALLEAGITLYLGDRVYPDLGTPVTAGLHVRIRRGTPVSVAVDGRVLRTRTQSSRVGEVLAELGVALVGQDAVLPPLEARIRDHMRIQVVRVAGRLLIEQEEIPYQTEWIADASLELDQRRVDNAGAPGVQRRRYRAIYHDGVEVERYLEDEWVAREPQPRQIAYGTRIVVRTLETPDGPIEYWRRIRVFLTSYTEATCSKTPDHPWYGLTRLGWKMRRGIVAVDPRVIHLRSPLYVPGYGRGVAGDTGGLIKGRHIDLGYEVDNFIMHYEWGYVYLLTPAPPASQIPWILPDNPRER